MERGQVTHRIRYRGSWSNSSANWGASLSVLHHVLHCDSGSTREEVKERLHDVASIQVHLRCQARMVGHLKYLGTSRALAKANCLMNSTDSSR